VVVGAEAAVRELAESFDADMPEWFEPLAVTDEQLLGAEVVELVFDSTEAIHRMSMQQRLRKLGFTGKIQSHTPDRDRKSRVEAAETSARRAAALTEAYTRRERATRAARRTVDAEELAEVVGERVKITARKFAEEPKPQAVMDGILAAEVNVLAGPEASGKSLWLRDIALCVAAGSPWRGHAVPKARDVLLVFSEGTHDFAERYKTQPLWDAAADRVWVLDKPVNLTADNDVDWLLREYRDEQPGLVAFDVIYAAGMSDDTGTKDVLPVLKALKHISAEWGAATLAVGHPPHDTSQRRMRGSSMWRQLAYTDWHMAEGRLTCEKSKIDHAAAHRYPYRTEYPLLHWLSTGDVLAEEGMRFAIIEASFDADPKMATRMRAALLAPELGVSIERARKLITAHGKARGVL